MRNVTPDLVEISAFYKSCQPLKERKYTCTWGPISPEVLIIPYGSSPSLPTNVDILILCEMHFDCSDLAGEVSCYFSRVKF